MSLSENILGLCHAAAKRIRETEDRQVYRGVPGRTQRKSGTEGVP
jgi:hypothetical protein